MTDIEFYLFDLKSKFQKINPIRKKDWKASNTRH